MLLLLLRHLGNDHNIFAVTCCFFQRLIKAYSCRNWTYLGMSTSEGSASVDSMEEDSTQVPRARRSKVWEHYEQDLVVVDGDLKAVCKYCGVQLQTKFGTTSLRSHIAESCRSIEDACRKRFLSTMKKKPSEGLFVFDEKVCPQDMQLKSLP